MANLIRSIRCNPAGLVSHQGLPKRIRWHSPIGRNQIKFQIHATATQAKGIACTLENSMVPKRANNEATVCAMQKAPIKAKEGRSMKNQPCDRVMKMRAWEMMATWR